MSVNNLHLQMVNELHSIFPDYEPSVLQSFLQAKSTVFFSHYILDFNLD